MVICKCFLVDGREVDIKVARKANGLDLFNSVCKFLNIQDKNAFGLIHRDGSKPSIYNWWIRLDRPLKSQIKGKCCVWVFALIVKFYPIKNIELCEEILRYFTLLQVRDDLLTGRLPCPTNTLAILAAYWAQSEYGQFSFRSLDQQLAEAFSFVRPDLPANVQNSDRKIFLNKMVEIHKKLRNMSSTDADIKFLALASTLSMYGTHYYPAFQCFFDSQRLFNKRPPELTDPVTVGLTYKGIYLHKAKKSAPQLFPWRTIHAIAFRKTLVLLKFHKTVGEKKRTHIYLAFEKLNQAKTLWRAAIELHVHCRVEKKVQENQVVSVKLKRRWSFSGQQQATTVKTVTTPRLRFPKLATIAEPMPASKLPPKEEKTTKDAISNDLKQKYSALFPLKSSKTSSPRAVFGQNPRFSLASFVQHDFGPFVGDLSKKSSDLHSLSTSNLPSKGKVPMTSLFDEDTLIDPPISGRSKNRRTVSETTIAGVEVFPASSEYVAGRNAVKRVQSCTEDHHYPIVENWLDENSVGKHFQRRRPQSAPSQHRPHLRGRSFNELQFHQRNKEHQQQSGASSRQQRASETKMKVRDLSPPPTITYEDEPTRRRPERYQSADNFVRKDWTIRREPVYAFDRAARRFADIYKNEYLQNLSDDPQFGSYRRAKSMHALGSLDRRTNRSPSLDCHLSMSSSTISACASSESHRSYDSFIGPYYNDDFYHRLSEVPPDSSLSRRILSESRLPTRPSRNSTYDGYLQQSKDNLDSTRSLHQRWSSAGRNTSVYSSHFDRRDSFF